MYARRRRKPEEREREKSGRTGPRKRKRERETERERRRGSELGEEDHRQKEKGQAGTKLRGRYASETCRNAKRCPGQEAGRARFWERYRAICAAQEIVDPPLGSRVYR